MNEKHQRVDSSHPSQTGLFILPIFDSRKYFVKVVNSHNSGVFEPEEIEIDLEGKSEAEITKVTEQQFNFKFAGFNIKETVLSLGSETSGPNGVELALYDAKGKEIVRTVTADQGVFTFKRLQLGQYTIKPVGASKKSFEFVKNSVLGCKTQWSDT